MRKTRHIFRALLYLAAFLPLLFPATALAQSVRQVRGVVYDENGEPFPGVAVIDRKQGIGVSTDIDGKFVLTGVPVNAVLSVEVVSYKSQVIKVSEVKGLVEIYLEPDSEMLEEV